MSKLVIVESPAKARTINRYLGSGYKVLSSMGHVRDLPKSKMGVDVENDFEPTYGVIKGREKTIKQLKSAAATADEVYLATDLDREGEAIAWHLAQAMKLDPETTWRVTFNEITASAVRAAFNHPAPIDVDKVNAQQARRVLDRIVGYELSPLLWRKVAKGLSAGRVQSVAVMLVVNREREIEAFEPEEYWEVEADLATEKGADSFRAKLARVDGEKAKLSDKAATDKLLEQIKDAEYTVAELKEKTKRGSPSPPFITSRLQQAAWSQLRFSTRNTMRIAQQLYEGVDLGKEGSTGLITYMRTDSVRIAPKALGEAREFIEEAYGKEYLPNKARQFKQGARAQAAHEAIRPTNVHLTPDSIKEYLDERQYKLYNLIWRQFVASQMAVSKRLVISVSIQAGPATFTCTGSRILFDGHERVGGQRENETLLPELSEGQVLELLKLDPSQHFTQPPPRFTEGSLVRTLERMGIGRPSTYAPIIGTIQERGYVRQQQRRFYATALGKVVTEELKEHFPRLLNVKFTSEMEDDLDRVESGEEDWRRLLGAFYGPFKGELEKAMEEMERVPGRRTEQKCDKCDKLLVIRSGKFGLFLGCEGYPECDFTKPLEEGEQNEPEETDEECPDCGKPLVVRRGPRGKFHGCSGYPDCKFTKPLKGGPRKAPEKTDIPCEKCGEMMLIRTGRRGRFLGCSGFPKCRNTKPLPGEEKEGGSKKKSKKKGAGKKKT